LQQQAFNSQHKSKGQQGELYCINAMGMPVKVFVGVQLDPSEASLLQALFGFPVDSKEVGCILVK